MAGPIPILLAGAEARNDVVGDDGATIDVFRHGGFVATSTTTIFWLQPDISVARQQSSSREVAREK